MDDNERKILVWSCLSFLKDRRKPIVLVALNDILEIIMLTPIQVVCDSYFKAFGELNLFSVLLME